MSDIVERLQDHARNVGGDDSFERLYGSEANEAADEIQSLRQRVERLEGELDTAWEHLTLVLSCDPGPKLAAAREDASRWTMAYDKAKEAALSPKVQEGE